MAKLYKLDLPLKKSVLGSRLREIGILKVETENGIGYGEVSPLPGFSNFFRALEWGKTCALQMIQATSRPVTVNINGLITEPDNALAEALEFQKQGYTHVKIKVGHGAETWKNILEQISRQTNLMLRLDGNFKLTSEDALELSKIPHVEYFEDPTTEKKFLKESPVKCVTDGIDVIKPTMTGFIPNHRKDIVLSSSYESALGIAHIAHAAHRFGLEKNKHGLDTLDVFSENIFEVKKQNGTLVVPSLTEICKEMDNLTLNLKPLEI